MVARDSLAMTWNAVVARNGPLVPIFDALRPASVTRASADGRLNTPVTSNVIISNGVKLWNQHHVQLVKIKTKEGLKNYVKKEVWKSIPT